MEALERGARLTLRVGAAAALIATAGMLFDIVLTMVPGWEAGTVPAAAAAWFAQFAANPLLGLRNLDLLNVVLSFVALPLYVALYVVLRRAEPGLALLALVLVAVGTALFAAGNAALPMLALSRRYASASVAERLALEAAGEALLARGAHGSLGALPGFLVSELGTLLMAVALLRTRALGTAAGIVGLAGAGLLAVYSFSVALAPGTDALIGALAVPGGLLMLAFNVIVARRLLDAARHVSPG